MSEHEKVENVLTGIPRPPFVTEIRHLLDTDHDGDPAVRIWVIFDDDTAASPEFLTRTEQVRSAIVEALREAEIDRWPYVRFRGQSEQAKLDRAEAA